jgi:hypothetical protein
MEMPKVDLWFKLEFNQFIVPEVLAFEAFSVNFADFQDPDNQFTCSGKIRGLWITDELDVFLYCTGQNGFVWELTVKVNEKELCDSPMSGAIRKGKSVLNQGYPLP